MSGRSLLLTGLGLAAVVASAGLGYADTDAQEATQPRAEARAATDLTPLPAEEWSLPHAAHLLRRAGFGGTWDEVQALYERGPEGAVEHLLSATDPEAAPFEPTLTTRPPRELVRSLGLSADEIRQVRNELRRLEGRQLMQLRGWWIERMVDTTSPLTERMTLFWHGHFCSGFQDTKNSYHLYLQNETFRTYALGSFQTLLHAVAKDPAMLEYLDNRSNRKSHPNENFAREVMELFTLGIGHYTEDDIREAARAFAGWTFEDNTFVKNRRQQDTGEKTFLGRTGGFDGEQVLDVILEQEATAPFLVRKLFRYFVHENPSDEVVAELARTFRKGDYELRPVLRRLFRSRAFYSPEAMGTQIKGPIELLVGLCRALEVEVRGVLLGQMATQLGQELLEPPNVKGWPGGREWVSTSTLLDRYNIASQLIGEVDREAARAYLRGRGPAREQVADALRQMQMQPDTMTGEMTDPNGKQGSDGRRRRFRERGRRRSQRELRVYDPLREVRARGLTHAHQVVDHFTTLLLCEPPTPEDRLVLCEALERNADGAPSPFRTGDRDAQRRVEAMLELLVSTPEFQLK